MIARKLKAYLDRRGIKYTKMGEAIGVSPQVASAIVAGRRKLMADELVAICDYFEITMDQLKSEELPEGTT